jgi:CTP:molybdopterin cytidylyltransferase MocA
MVAILIPAAGASARMAPRDKLLEPVGGEPLLRRTARAALATGAPVLCTLPTDRPARAAALAGLALTRIAVPDAARGMSASLGAGVAALPPGCAGVMVLPADMPGIATQDLARLLAAFADGPGRILRGAAADGRPGHPVLFPADLFPELRRLEGDEGGRVLLRRHAARVTLVPLPGDRAVLDLDTPADWAAFRARRDGGAADGAETAPEGPPA